MIKRIKQDQLSARKSKDKVTAGILTALIGEVSIVGKNDGNRETTDKEAIKVITKFAKGISETIDLVQKANISKEDIDAKVDILKNELKIYNSYLPNQLTEDDLTVSIGLFLQTEKEPNIGKVMGYLKSNFEGQYDGKMASKLIRELLN